MTQYLESYEKVLEDLASSEAGLPQGEAEKRLREQGRNELDKAEKKSLLHRLVEQLTNPMVLILLAAAAVSVAITIVEGEREFAEAAIILTVVIINSVLGVFQESKAEKAIEALQEMNTAIVKVRRGGVVEKIHASELVIGDIVLLESGDGVPADMRLGHCASLRIEEAALTGESVPVDKITEALRGDESGKVALGDRRNMAYMGSGVAYGRGEGIVTATGMATEVGKIAGLIQSTVEGQTPLQKRLAQLSRILTIAVLGICVVIFAIQLLRAEGISAGVILPSFMLAVSLAVAAIPEGLVAVVTIVLSIGVTNMAKRNAIIRRLTAVETLGCAQIICTDKTGTLTQNKMTVVESYGETALLAKAMALCCDSTLAPDGSIIGDPTENALVAFALKEGFNKNALEAESPRVDEAPFDSGRKMMSTVHSTPQGIIQYTKGAPDEVLRVCTQILVDGKPVELTRDRLQILIEKNQEYANSALRVLACAYREWDELPKDCTPAHIENDLVFVGLEALIDPLRPEVKAAMEECKHAGIRVVMITGDHRDTAAAIALEAGVIANREQAITGRELEELSDAAFAEQLDTLLVYARVQPEHKLRIVNMWKSKGYITAMTGDGVNDAPAIKTSDIGIGMGITGTDVTKNVADMVLADDNFATIVAAVEEGRKIYENIRKTIQFLLSSNLSEVVSIFVATLFGIPFFGPIHLLYINLITDSIPAIALGMEGAEPGIMERPPRGLKDGVFSGGLGFDVLYQGVMVAFLTLGAYFIIDDMHGHIDPQLRHSFAITSAFLTINMCEIFHSFNLRSRRLSCLALRSHNPMIWGAMIVALAMVLSTIYIPAVAGVFSLAPLTLPELAVSLGLSVSVIPLVELVKALQRAMKSK